MEEELDEYDETLVWALEEEKIRTTRGQGVSSFYLVVIGIIILFIVFLFLYFSNRGKKLTALDMINDPDNVFDEFSEDVELIDMTEDEDDKQTTDEPEIKEVVGPN
jgi:hypothetical protein